MEPDVKIEATINVPEDVPRDTLAFVQQILGPVAEASDFLSDRIRFFRWKTAINTLERAKQISRNSSLSPNPVPVKFLVPFLEKCSLEDDAYLIEKWAALLASTSENCTSSNHQYINILSDISVDEAMFLDSLFDSVIDDRFSYDNFLGLDDDAEFDKSLIIKEIVRFEDDVIIAPIKNDSGEWTKENAKKRWDSLVDERDERLLELVDAAFNSQNDNGQYVLKVEVTHVTTGEESSIFSQIKNDIRFNNRQMFGLRRLGLIDVLHRYFSDDDDSRGFSFGTYVYVTGVVITPLGYDFVKTCRGLASV